VRLVRVTTSELAVRGIVKTCGSACHATCWPPSDSSGRSTSVPFSNLAPASHSEVSPQATDVLPAAPGHRLGNHGCRPRLPTRNSTSWTYSERALFLQLVKAQSIIGVGWCWRPNRAPTESNRRPAPGIRRVSCTSSA
jgi:hypothetical protein